MAKEPKVGSTKTRLCPPLTPEEAAAFYEALLLDTIDLASKINNVDLAVAVTPPESTPYFEKNSPEGTVLVPVDCEDIGQCLYRVLGQLLKMGYEKVAALNSDGPTLPGEYIQRSYDRLEEFDIVLGPSEDGGYYLVGLKEIRKQIFTGIDWSTSSVMRQTLEKCQNLGLNVDLLPSWYDIDTVKDIERLSKEIKGLPDHTAVHSRVLLKSPFWKRR